MTNGQKTANFLGAVDAATRASILSNIANHYGISVAEARAEVTGDEAEHLCDYITGPIRSATSLLMKRHGMF